MEDALPKGRVLILGRCPKRFGPAGLKYADGKLQFRQKHGTENRASERSETSHRQTKPERGNPS